MRKCHQGEAAGDPGQLGRGVLTRLQEHGEALQEGREGQNWPVIGSQDFRQEIWPERWLPLAWNAEPSLHCRVMLGKRGWKFRLFPVAIPEPV